MAEIPLEKKSGIPGWVWLLLALLLAALLLWWLLADDDEEVAVVENDTVAAAPVVPVAAGAYAIGESVDLDNVRVTSLAGDMAFNADVNGQNMLVLFDQEPTPGTPTEGEFDINPGMVMNLEGTVRSASDPLPAGVTIDQMGGADRYIYATDMEVVSRP